MKRLSSLMVLFAILIIGICTVSCSDDEPTMEVAYDSSCNNSVVISIYEDGVGFSMNRDVSGIVISNNPNDLEDMDKIGYTILKNYIKYDGFNTPELIGNVLFEGGIGAWGWSFNTNQNTDETPYPYAERNTTYYYRLLAFGFGREGGNLMNIWLHYGDIAEFTTTNE